MITTRLRVLLLSIALLVGYYPPSHTQSSSSRELFTRGIALLREGKYELAQNHLEAYITSHDDNFNVAEAYYCVALCAVELGQPNGEMLLSRFVKTYPRHPRAAQAYYHLGNLYFTRQDFPRSIAYYLQVDSEALNMDAHYAFQYRLAYAYFNEQDLERASIHFDAVKVRENTYCYAASYYAGCIAFKHGDYASALADLMRASQNAAYRTVVPYWIIQIYYNQKRFQELLHYASALDRTEIALREKGEIALLMAEAHFFTEDYVSAAKHYEEYIALEDLVLSVVSGEVLYRTGYALYQAGELHKALRYFKQLALQEDAIGQLASYYVGLIYVKIDQKQLALIAFEKAKCMFFSPIIREEATFLYAKVSYELGDFSTAVATIQGFQKDYIASRHLAETDVMLSEACLHTRDYDLAITHIEQLASPLPSVLELYQRITFYKGGEYFNNDVYNRAIDLLKQSLRYPLNQVLSTQAQLWLGESYSALQQYAQAIPIYQRVLASLSPTDPSYTQAVYGLGYAYFNTSCYPQAMLQFLEYDRQPQDRTPTPWRQDARLRLADCYYAIKDYQKALQCYSYARSYRPAYVHYQEGIVCGILKNKQAALTSFQVILDHYADTIFYEKALLEIARIDLTHNNYQQAIQQLTKLIRQRPQSTLIPDAFLYRAVAYVNLAQYDRAIQDYEQLLKRYPKHTYAQSALLELSRICSLVGKPEHYEAYLTAYQATNPDLDTLESMAFSTAKSLFYDQYYDVSLAQLHSFCTSYPESKWLPEVKFLIAEIYYRQDDLPKALTQYKMVLKEPKTPLYNKILWRLGDLAYRQEDFVQAHEYYQELEKYAKTDKENCHAWIGLMQVSYTLQQYTITQRYARMILESETLMIDAIKSARLFLGKVAVQQHQYQEAKIHLLQVVQNAPSRYAAEAQYLLARIHYESKEYKKSLALLFELKEKYPIHTTWLDQGFLLMVENYLSLGEDLQAQATLQSIIANAGAANTVAIAKQRLAALQHSVEFTKEEKLSDTESVISEANSKDGPQALK